VRECLAEWEQRIEATTQKVITQDFQPTMSALTLDIVSRCVFGSNLSSDAKSIVAKFLFDTLEIQGQRIYNLTGVIPLIRDLPLPAKQQVARLSAETRKVLEMLIQDRRDGKSSKRAELKVDLLDLLLQATIHDKVTGTEMHFSNEEIFEHCVTFILAGHETTSNLLTWCTYYITQHPEYMRKGQAEVDAVLNGKPPTSAQLQQLPYIEALLLETLRISGPIPNVVREAEKDNDITASDGKRIHIKAGTVVHVNLYRLHHNDKYWPQPFQFNPSRWLDDGSNDRIANQNHNDARNDTNHGTDTSADNKSDVVEVAKRKRIQPYISLGFGAGCVFACLHV
jgi:cytochrome P450